MSKIEEMAEKEVPIRAWDDNITINWCRQIYCLGANAILREIEDVLPHLAKNGVIYSIIKDKIKELKGV